MAVANENITDLEKDGFSASGFFNHVFNFDTENKAIIFNSFQYLIFALVPIVIILKVIKFYIPEEDDSKNSIEILFEIILQLFIIVFAIFIIDKVIRYFPTFSKINYSEMNIITIILPTLILMLTMQTKIGHKINILVDRVNSYINKNEQPIQSNKNSTNNNIQQLHQGSRADQLDNTIIPQQAGQMNMQNNGGLSMIDSLPNNMNNMNNMNNNPNIPNGVMQNVFEDQGPMAANDLLGGSMF
jgi:hypothetical protein